MFGQDLRYAIRQLRMSLGFTLSAIHTLALSVGASTTVATWTNALNPRPQVAQARSLCFVEATVLDSQMYSGHKYQFLRSQGRSFSNATVFEFISANLNLPDSGGVGSIAAVRVLRSMPFEVTAFDPLSFSGAAIALALTVLLAGLAPAR